MICCAGENNGKKGEAYDCLDCRNRRFHLFDLLWYHHNLCRIFHILFLDLAGRSVLFVFDCIGKLVPQRTSEKGSVMDSVSMYTFFAASLVIFCVVEMLIFLGAAGSDTGRMDYVIVLGARVREEGPSNSLRVRLDKAVEYSKSNPGTIFILSGGQGLDEPEAEASVMYDYLLAHGVPAERMALENVSTSTVENIAYSKVLIEHMEKERREELQKQRPSVAPGPYLEVEEKPLQIGILTSNYHVFRAKKIGEKWGLPNLHGIAAKSDLILFPHLCVRECIAILKDQLMGNM